MTDLEREMLELCRAILEASESGIIYQQNADREMSRQAAKVVKDLETRLRAMIAQLGAHA